METNIVGTIDSKWRIVNAIKVNDICIINPLEQEFLCVYKAPYEHLNISTLVVSILKTQFLRFKLT